MSPSRALATSMVVAPVLLLTGTALTPSAMGQRHGTDRGRSLELLQELAVDRGRIPVAVLLISLGLGLLVPAAIGLARLSGGGRAAVLGTSLVTVGAPMGVFTNAVGAMVAYRLTDRGIPPGSALDAFAYDSGSAGAAPFLLFLLLLVGLVVLGVAVWRSHRLRWWQAALLCVGPVVGFAAPEGPMGALATIPFLAGLSVAARQLVVSQSAPDQRTYRS